VDALTRHFARVQAERMAGLPLLNPALSVEAVGFEWAAQTEDEADSPPVAEGVLVTPWFMSLVRLPLAVLPHGNRVGCRAVRRFGNERFDFIGGHDQVLGFHETCALFSPMNGFSSQALARETALASLALLRPSADAPATPVTPATPPSQINPATPAEPVPARRSFLLGGRPRQGAAA
jgi:[NiFe] hydrogenase assembly HybE family chaperone